MVCEVWREGRSTPVELRPASAAPSSTAPPECKSAVGLESGKHMLG